MKIKILDTKSPGDRTWLLCKGNLLEYLTELKEEFYDFAIQRKIVKNQYLDTLLETIIQKDPIPLITLTYNQSNLKIPTSNEIDVDVSKVEILDGLQRTFRLWAYLKANEILKSGKFNTPSEFAKRLKDKHPVVFETGVITLGKIKNKWEQKEIEKVRGYFNDFEIYFAIWVNLSDKKIIEKMLLLNAGQKSVSKTHQFELLFLHIWDDLKNNPNFTKDTGITLFREKEIETNKIKLGNRSIGQYVFSSVVVSLLSYIEGIPQRIGTDDLFPADQSKITESDDSQLYQNIFDQKFVIEFLKNLKEIDTLINEKEPIFGLAWFIKDTTLSGMLAALGKFKPLNNEMTEQEIFNQTSDSFKTLESKIKLHGYNLKSFQEEYNNLSSRSVNIGNFIRKVITNYTYDMLESDKVLSWETYFNVAKKQDEL